MQYGSLHSFLNDDFRLAYFAINSRSTNNSPNADASSQEVSQWLDTNPSFNDCLDYLKRLERSASGLGLCNYCPAFAHKLEVNFRKNRRNVEICHRLLGYYGRAFLKGLQSPESAQFVQTPQGSWLAIHGCATLGVSDPILKQALKAADYIHQQDLPKCQLLQLLVRLGRGSNIVASKAKQEYLDLITPFINLKPDDNESSWLKANSIHASFYAEAHKDFSSLDELRVEFSKIKLPTRTTAFDYMRDALTYAIFFPKEPYPIELREGLSQLNQTPWIGYAEEENSSIICDGIKHALRRKLLFPGLPISQNINLPFDVGPFNVDFYFEVSQSIFQKKRAVAIEINGRGHYCFAEKKLLLKGKDTLKSDILRLFGIHVLSIANSELLAPGINKLQMVADRVASCGLSDPD